jgi:hypothetical protein
MKQLKSDYMKFCILFLAAVLAAFTSKALLISEKFATDPALDGWHVVGNTNLFQWDSADQNIAVAWNSTNANSYFYHPLGVTLNSASNFMFAVDFNLQDIAIGTTPNKPQNFQIAFGLLNFAEATQPKFVVGTGTNAPDIVELDYFPDSGFGASVTTPMISSANSFAPGGFTFPLELVPGGNYHAVLVYTADNQTLHTIIFSNGVAIGPINNNFLAPGFGDFQVDTLSINCYTDQGQDTNFYFGVDFAGSIIAHASVDNLVFATPLPVTQIIDATASSVQFTSTTNWNYVLERSADFSSWSAASPTLPGVAGTMTLADPHPPADKAFYRVRADVP